MNIQLTLLSIIVALFMTIWSNDVQMHNAAVPNVPAQKIYESVPTRPVSQIQQAPAADAVQPPLPAGIAPGRYQVVNHNGDAQILNLQAYELPQPVAPARDFYMNQQGSQRWYFIRLNETEHEPAVVLGEDQMEIPRTAALDEE